MSKNLAKKSGFVWMNPAKSSAQNAQQVLPAAPKPKTRDLGMDGFSEPEQLAIIEASVPSPYLETWVTVTPAMANDWLTNRNTKNRPMGERRIRAIAADIQHGRYGRTHQGVAFNILGVLADGQHRLAAICLADIPVTMRVTFGLPEESINNIDANLNPRSAGDIMSMQGVVKGKSVAAMARSICIMETGNDTPSFAILQETYNRFRDDIEWVRPWIHRGERKSLTAHICAAFAYAHSVHPEETAAVLHMVGTGLNIGAGSAASAIVSAIAFGRERQSVSNVETMRKILRALQVHVSGGSLMKLQDTPLGLRYFQDARIALGKT